MTSRRSAAVLLAIALLIPAVLSAQNVAPREIWPQIANAAREGDSAIAEQKMLELMNTAKQNGIKTFPLYASAAAGLARQDGVTRETSDWALKAAAQLDPKSPQVAFSNADRAAGLKNWPGAIPAALRGFGYIFTDYRTGVLGRADFAIVLVLAIAVAAAIFAIALFIRYGRSMAHDFRELLSRRFHGGSVTVLAFALLFLPLFLWLGPMWLVFYWFVIFFGYASKSERTVIIILALLVALSPILLDLTAHWAAGVDSPAVMAAISSRDQSYQPEALRRLQELVALVPKNATLLMLLGNLEAFEGNDQAARSAYNDAIKARDSAGAHVNLGNLHFLNNEFQTANIEYATAQRLDSNLAIAFYNNSVASGEQYKFDEQGQMLEQARKRDRSLIESLSARPPAQKIVFFKPSLSEAWRVSEAIAKSGAARSQFGNYSYFDPKSSAVNPVTIGALAALLLSILLWLKRRRHGYAGACIKCGRTFCHRCKSARESATYCTQCIHIYLKRDGVSLDTKRHKLEEVTDHHAGIVRRNKLFATFLPGSAQVLEGRTTTGVIGMFLFVVFVALAVLVGRLAPALGPSAGVAQLLVRVLAIVLAVVIWFLLSLPVYRRRTSAA
jgi:tetratricopeptide (TPR) repeat protein